MSTKQGWVSVAIGAAYLVMSSIAQAADANTTVNPQITDAVTQANTEVVGDAPAVGMGNLYQASAQSLGNAAHNATSAQQNANTILQATTTQGVSMLYGVDTASTGVATSELTGGGD